MFDIIIPAYNAHQTIWKTLFSLSIQKASRLLDVCIINDNSNENYQKEILFFQQLNCFNSIIEIINLENMGVGYSRNKGLQATKKNNNKWFIFLDADDYLYSPYSISNFYDIIQNQPNLAIIHGECIEEQSPSIESPFSYNILSAQINNNLQSIGKIPTYQSCEYFIDHFVYRLSMYLNAEKERNQQEEEDSLLCKMLLYLLYRDTVKPLLFQGEERINQHWKRENRCHYWYPKKNFDIFSTIQDLKAVYDEKQFQELCQKHIVFYGYFNKNINNEL